MKPKPNEISPSQCVIEVVGVGFQSLMSSSLPGGFLLLADDRWLPHSLKQERRNAWITVFNETKSLQIDKGAIILYI